MQMVGAMHKLTAVRCIDTFAVGLLGGRRAQVTSESAIFDSHRERNKKRNERTKERCEGKHISKLVPFASAWGIRQIDVSIKNALCHQNDAFWL